MDRRRSMMFGAVVALAAVVVLAAVLVSRGSGESESGPSTKTDPTALFAGIPQQGAWLGRPDAPVIVEEYLDLQCPFCAKFAMEQLPLLIDEEVRTGRVRLRMRIVSILGPDSAKAAKMAAAARLQNRGWQFAEAFYAEQGAENSGYVNDVFVRGRAEAAGVDVERALRDRELEPTQRALAADASTFKRSELEGTPGFRVGPRGGTLTNFDPNQVRTAIKAAADDS
jgi:protein-disulfide isomerase